MRSLGMMFPGNAARTNCVPFWETAAGSYRAINCPAPFLRLEKLPSSQSCTGTDAVVLEALRVRVLCSLKKKKVRFLPLYTFGKEIGPPIVPPNWLRWKAASFTPLRLLLQVLVSSLLLRR